MQFCATSKHYGQANIYIVTDITYAAINSRYKCIDTWLRYYTVCEHYTDKVNDSVTVDHACSAASFEEYIRVYIVYNWYTSVCLCTCIQVSGWVVHVHVRSLATTPLRRRVKATLSWPHPDRWLYPSIYRYGYKQACRLIYAIWEAGRPIYDRRNAFTGSDLLSPTRGSVNNVWNLDILDVSSGGPHLTQRVVGPHKCTCQMASKSVERLKQAARMWQTIDRPWYG